MARPKKNIDPEQVRKLSAIQCSYAEMASVLGCNESTLTRRFAQDIKEGRDHGRMSLKRKQYESAMGGNTTMLIWLGKQYLGQSDKVDQTSMISGTIETEKDRAILRDQIIKNYEDKKTLEQWKAERRSSSE